MGFVTGIDAIHTYPFRLVIETLVVEEQAG